MTANQIIVSALKGKNIITPNIMKYGFTNKNGYAFELSYGTGFNDEPVYGVTLVDKNTFKSLHELNQMFFCKDKAINYIDKF